MFSTLKINHKNTRVYLTGNDPVQFAGDGH